MSISAPSYPPPPFSLTLAENSRVCVCVCLCACLRARVRVRVRIHKQAPTRAEQLLLALLPRTIVPSAHSYARVCAFQRRPPGPSSCCFCRTSCRTSPSSAGTGRTCRRRRYSAAVVRVSLHGAAPFQSGGRSGSVCARASVRACTRACARACGRVRGTSSRRRGSRRGW